MGLLDDVKGVLAQYASGGGSAANVATHFDQVAQTGGSDVLAQGVSEIMRSDQTPDFGNLVGQLFANGTADQKAGMLNALIAAVPTDQRAKLSALIPGLAGVTQVTGAQANAIPPTAVSTAAAAVEEHPNVIDQMSQFYAQHPALVKTLGTAALMVAMRGMSRRRL
jgi:hypothetical protein